MFTLHLYTLKHKHKHIRTLTAARTGWKNNEISIATKRTNSADTVSCCFWVCSCWAKDSIYSYDIVPSHCDIEAESKKYCSYCYSFFFLQFLLLLRTVGRTMNYIRNYISSEVADFGFYELIFSGRFFTSFFCHVHPTNSLSQVDSMQKLVHFPSKTSFIQRKSMNGPFH